MKLKLLIPLLAAALTFTACADIPPVKEPVPQEQQIIISPPEDGWTAAELMSRSYINNVQLEYPLTMRSLGSGFSIMGLFSRYTVNSSDSSEIRYSLEYNDSENIENMMLSPAYAFVSYGSNEDNVTADDAISYLDFFSENISINGVKYSTPEDEIEKHLGKPDDIVEEDNEKFVRYIYLDKESGKELISVRVMKENKEVRNITITF